MKKLMAFIGIILGTVNVFSQGSGADGALTVAAVGTTIDGTKSQLTATASAGATTVTVNSATGFAVNQVCLLIQMRGTGCGNYEEKTISSISGTTITFSSSLTYAYTVNGSTSQAQLIKMPQYTNVTINSGASLTCTAWDGNTGGVVCFLANGTVTVTGSVTATGRGGAAGNGGSAGVADGPGSGGGGGAGTTDGCGGTSSNGLTPAGGGRAISGPGTGQAGSGGGGTGGDGGTAWNFPVSNPGTGGTALIYSSTGGTISAGTGGSNNSNSNNWGFNGSGQSLMMGGGGSGGNGGAGGGSGGGGGGGGGTNDGTGFPGEAGSKADGGAGGAGGAGGGIIYFRCHTLAGAGTLVSNGSNGTSGGSGYSGCGGRGGAQYNVCQTGGAGGDGAAGYNGNGGNGGSGGGPGAILTYATSANTFSGTSTTNAGSAGSGGTQGGAGHSGGLACGVYTGSSGTDGSSGGGGTSTTSSKRVETLPINLIAFSGVAEVEVNKLYWTTATESNNEYFLIERSIDGINYIGVLTVKGCGTCVFQNNYSACDDNISSYITYYRLRQFDYDGKSTVSEAICLVRKTLNANLFVHPNPATDKINVSYTVEENQNVMFKIEDANGKLVYEKPQILYKGTNTVGISVDDLSCGQYIVTIVLKGKMVQAKFIRK